MYRPAALVMTVLLAAIALAHWPEFAGVASSDPLPWAAHLSEALPRSLLPGLPGFNDPNAGTTTQALGGLAARDWLAGVVPWWNPYSGAGLPLAAEMQNSALFLPFVLLLRLSNGMLLLKIALQIVAGFSTYPLLRALDLRRVIALSGAACFALNGTFAWMAHGPIMPVAFLPVMLLGIEKLRSGGGWGGSALIAIGMFYALISGFPETAYLDGLLAGCWAALRLAQAQAGERPRFAVLVGAGGCVGLLLAAPALLAFLDSLGASSLGYHESGMHFILPTRDLALFVTPYAYGPISFAGQWVEAGFMGGFLQLGLLPLALMGFAGRRGRGLRCLLGLWVAATVAQSFGAPVVSPLINAIPLLGKVELCRYIWPSWELSFVILACLGMRDWMEGLVPAPRVWAALTVAAVVVVGGLCLGASHLRAVFAQAPGVWIYAGGSVIFAALVLGVVAVVLLRPRGRFALPLLAAVLAGEAVCLSSFTLLSGSRGSALDWPAVQFLQAHIGLARCVTLGPIAPNYGALFGLASVNVDYLPILTAWPAYVHRHLHPAGDIAFVPGDRDRGTEVLDRIGQYEQAGVKYAVAYHDSSALAGMLPRVFAGRSIDVYELPAPAPYFEIVNGHCALVVRDRTHVEARCSGPALLLRREMIAPGWGARVNGRSAQVMTAAEIFQSLALPAGASVITFCYEPSHMVLGYAAFGLGVGALVLGAVFTIRRRRECVRWALAEKR